MPPANPVLWLCPLCDYRVPFGKGCPNKPQPDQAWECALGVKNAHWDTYHALHEGKTSAAGKGVGISEISDEGKE